MVFHSLKQEKFGFFKMLSQLLLHRLCCAKEKCYEAQIIELRILFYYVGIQKDVPEIVLEISRIEPHNFYFLIP